MLSAERILDLLNVPTVDQTTVREPVERTELNQALHICH